MADWFKFHENDIDEMRLQWAIGELPEVLSVWIVLLSEACRHKDGTLSGYKEDFELFGISKRINVTVPKVNTGIELLVKIGYLKRLENGLLIRKWDEKQSEYCQRKTAMQNQKGDKNPMKRTKKAESVGTVSGQCRDNVGQEEIEERRRDRGEDKNASITKDSNAIEVLRYLNMKTGKTFQNVESNIKMINARIKDGATLDDLKRVVDVKCKKWLSDPKMSEYLRPATLFNAEKFAQYSGESSSPLNSKAPPSMAELDALNRK